MSGRDVYENDQIRAQRDDLRVRLAESVEERVAALRVERELRAALKLAEPALRTLRDGHCNAECDCAYTKALNAVVAALRGKT